MQRRKKAIFLPRVSTQTDVFLGKIRFFFTASCLSEDKIQEELTKWIIMENFDHQNMCPIALYWNTKVNESKEIFQCKQCVCLQEVDMAGIGEEYTEYILRYRNIGPCHIILDILDLFRF